MVCRNGKGRKYRTWKQNAWAYIKFAGRKDKIMALPPLKKIDYSLNHFPSDWQAVIFRNWKLVPAQRLAKILCTDEQTVIKEALKLGLENSEYNEDWLSNQNVIETALMAEVCYIHFYSALLQFQFNSLKTSTGNEKHLIKLAKDELKLTKNLYRIISHDARIGFEPSNHYFYYSNLLLEKILNLKDIMISLKRI